jgi:hypothetical protein
MKKIIFTCTQCKGQNVGTQTWVNFNTKEVGDSICPEDEDFNWCDDCKEHVEVDQKEIDVEEKQCEIINEQFSFVLKVDGKRINFNGFDNADYFKDHYIKLGYVVKMIDLNM